jgi:HTH-type transcriptional regulator/antitoxin HigA
MNIRPIRTETDYQVALAEIERLFDATPGTPEGDRLEVLTTLVEAYEERKYDIPLPDPIDALRYHIESRGLSTHDLEQYFESSTILTEVLNRKRALSIEMIRQLHNGLGISADVLIQPYSVAA